MGKQNYTLRKIKNQEVKEIFDKINKNIEQKLRDKKIIKRRRVVKDYGILIKAILLYITEKLSFQRLSDLMALKYDVVMSDVAWRKQIMKTSNDFFDAAKQCFHEIFEEQAKERSIKILDHDHSYAFDATNLAGEGKNAPVMRMHTQYSLDLACSDYVLITDNHTAESTTHFQIEEGALYLADRAYGRSKQLDHLNKGKADFIIRISPHSIRFFKDKKCKKKIDLHKCISNISGEKFALNCFVKSDKSVFPVRIFGIKKPDDKQKKSEKKVKRKAQKNQNELSQKTIDFSKWLLLAVSPKITASYDEIFFTYRLRWQIELFFKRMKSHMHIHKIRHSSSAYSKCVSNLWFAIGFLVSSVKLCFDHSFDFDISDFNLFSLILKLFA